MEIQDEKIKERIKMESWFNTEVRKRLAKKKGKKVVVGPELAKKTVKKTRPVHRTRKISTARHPPSLSSARGICHNIYNYLQSSGLIITPTKDIKIGKLHSININESGSEKLYSGQQNYNSYLLITHVVALLDRGTVIYFGPPGTGKTTAPELVAHYLLGKSIKEIQEATIYGHPELTFNEMLAAEDVGKLIKGKVHIVPRKFILSKVRIIDEVNRIPPSKLSILYQVADRGIANYKGTYIRAPPGPLFATANEADSGNYPIPFPFLDRFDVSVRSQPLNPLYLKFFNKRKVGKLNTSLDNLLNVHEHLTQQQLKQIRREIKATQFSPEALSKLAYFICGINYCDLGGRDIENKSKANCTNKKPGPLCADCSHYGNNKNICSYTENIVSPRTYRAVYDLSKAISWWIGEREVTDPKTVMRYTISHKIKPTQIAFEKDPYYINDKYALVDDMWENSCASYEQDKRKIKSLDEITEIIARVNISPKHSGVKRKDIEDILTKEVTKVDNPIKFALAVALYDLAEKL